MRTKMAVIFGMCWLLMGISMALAWVHSIRDFIWYGFCCDNLHLYRMIITIIGLVCYSVISLLFIFHKDFRK